MSDAVERMAKALDLWVQTGEAVSLGNMASSALDALINVVELEWEDYPINGDPVVSMAVTPLGTYFICDDVDDFSSLYLYFVGHKNATWYGTVESDGRPIIDHIHLDDHTPIQDSALADYRSRLRKALG